MKAKRASFCGTVVAAFVVCCLPVRVMAEPLTPIPDKLVVLSFDDAVRSHLTLVAPLLKKYGFGATFYISEGFDFHKDWKMKHLRDHGYTVTALRDLARYVDPHAGPQDPLEPIQRRLDLQKHLQGRSPPPR